MELTCNLHAPRLKKIYCIMNPDHQFDVFVRQIISIATETTYVRYISKVDHLV